MKVRSDTEIKILKFQQRIYDEYEALMEQSVINIENYKRIQVGLALCQEILNQCRILEENKIVTKKEINK